MTEAEPCSRPQVRDRLVEMFTQDMIVRDRLAADGSLFQGYHPEMQAVHDRHAVELDALLGGAWPTIPDVGTEGQNAAWRIVQHAIAQPGFQRRYLTLIRDAAARGQAPGWQVAMLEDRVRFFEGRNQLYGTQFDWDANGELSPLPIEDADGVDARRAALGLESLAATTARQRAQALAAGDKKPADPQARQAAFEAWTRQVGWRT
jgi:hypothetical protein